MTKKANNTKTTVRNTPIKDDTKLLRKKSTCGESEAWDDVLLCLPPKRAVSFGTLVKTVAKKLEGDARYTRRIVGSLRRRGCIAVASK